MRSETPGCSYDAIVMPFVLTLLAAPSRPLDNCRRMLRPGGEIIIVSHFQSMNSTLAGIERWLAPRVAGLGLRPDFPLARITAWRSAMRTFPRRSSPLRVLLASTSSCVCTSGGTACDCHPTVA